MNYSYVVHDLYGCESGCCGHRFYLYDDAGNKLDDAWEFIHPYGADHNEWAILELKTRWRDAVVRLDLCEVQDD